MRFPTVGEIATTSVVTIKRDNTLLEAIEIMCEQGHRNVVVDDSGVFFILRINDFLDTKIREQGLDISLHNVELAQLPVMNKNETILDTMECLSCNIEYICVVNDDKTLYGIVTHTDITSSIDPDTLMNNFCLHDFLKLGRRARWIEQDLSTKEVLDEMRNSASDSVIIVEDKKPIGIFTTKDIMRIIRKNSNLDLPIKAHMSSPVESMSIGGSVKEALEFLKQKHFKRVVVVDEMGNMAGVVTQKELISLTYSKWAIFMKEHQEELNLINETLISKNKKIEQLASRDPLTNLYNRYKFSQLFDSLYETMSQNSSKMSLILIDIDYFKKINDTYGHNVGDEVLVQISELIRRLLRESDVVGRWGGEEFVVLLPLANLENALNIADQIRGLIEGQTAHPFKITASFGVTEVKESDDLKSVIDRADTALYEAKESGRNRIKAR